MVKQIIKLSGYMAGVAPPEHAADVYGPLAVRKGPRGAGFLVSHVPSGLSVMSHFARAGEVLSLKEASARVQASREKFGDAWAALDALPFDPGSSVLSQPEFRAALIKIAGSPIWAK